MSQIYDYWYAGRSVMYSFFFFFLVIVVCFYWGLVVLQRCIHFCCTTKWISYMHTYIPSLLDLPPAPILPIKVITEHCAEPPELYRRFPLAAYFTNGSVYVCAYVSILLSQFVPPSPPPPCTHIRPLYPHLSSCPANRFICTIFLDSTKNRTTIWPGNPTTRHIYPETTLIPKDTYTPIFTAALFTIART